jgi:hypothetical protein
MTPAGGAVGTWVVWTGDETGAEDDFGALAAATLDAPWAATLDVPWAATLDVPCAAACPCVEAAVWW